MAQLNHVAHQIDQDEVRNAMMQLQADVGVVQGEVHVQHVQGEHEQLQGVAQEGHVTHQIDQDEVKTL
jgi:DNA-binding TFAR19-related protein (PDSD5 family)